MTLFLSSYFLMTISASSVGTEPLVIEQTILSDNDDDQRQSPFSCGPGRLDSSAIYKLLKAKDQASDPSAEFIWKNAAPPRVQLFTWLLIKGRIQCRANLYKKHVVDKPACLSCGAAEETPQHIIFHCPKAIEFWAVLGVPLPQPGAATRDIPVLLKINSVPAKQHNMLLALCCWQI